MALLIEADDSLLIDVIACNNLKVFKPIQLISDAEEEIKDHPDEWENSGSNSDSQSGDTAHLGAVE